MKLWINEIPSHWTIFCDV